MSKRFPIAFRMKMVSRLTGVNCISAAQLSRETGITQQSLSRWLSQARELPLSASVAEIESPWTVEQKARILLQAGNFSGDELVRYLDGEGVRILHFRRWRIALEEAGEESVGIAKQIGRLERELTRKNRALAEATTLLLLRESAKSCSHNGEDTEESDELDRSDLRQFVLRHRLSATAKPE